MCGRFQLVRFLTPIELSNFPSNTKIIKNKPESKTRATCTLQKMKPGWIAESSWGYILCTTQGQRTTKNVCSCKPSYRLHHASLTGKSSLLTKEKWGQCPRYRGWEGDRMTKVTGTSGSKATNGNLLMVSWVISLEKASSRVMLSALYLKLSFKEGVPLFYASC